MNSAGRSGHRCPSGRLDIKVSKAFAMPEDASSLRAVHLGLASAFSPCTDAGSLHCEGIPVAGYRHLGRRSSASFIVDAQLSNVRKSSRAHSLQFLASRTSGAMSTGDEDVEGQERVAEDLAEAAVLRATGSHEAVVEAEESLEKALKMAKAANSAELWVLGLNVLAGSMLVLGCARAYRTYQHWFATCEERRACWESAQREAERSTQPALVHGALPRAA